jgi:hypothetical protein
MIVANSSQINASKGKKTKKSKKKVNKNDLIESLSFVEEIEKEKDGMYPVIPVKNAEEKKVIK